MKRKITRGKLFIRRLQRFVNTTIIGGLLVMLPLSIFILVMRFIYRTITNLVAPISQVFNFSEDINQWVVDLTSVGIVIGLFFFIGLFVRTTVGRQIITFVEENWLKKLPFYDTLRKTVQAFGNTEKTPFSQVVLINVFNSPTKMTGFITAELPNDMVTVFVPTGPNPTNGFIFHMQKDQVELVDVKVEDAMRTIVGVGVGSEILFPQPPPKALPSGKKEENQNEEVEEKVAVK